jgi:hypothetical protein
LLVRGNVSIYRAQKAIQGDDCYQRRRSWSRSPPLAPVRNSFELRGLCCRSCFFVTQSPSWHGSQSHKVHHGLCECLVRGNVLIYRAQKEIQGDGCRPRPRSRPRSPLLDPIRNSSESRGLSCRSCFGPRACDRRVTNSSKLPEFSIRVSPYHPYNADRVGLGWGGGCP